MSTGWVYVLTNEAMPGFVKIGLTQANDVAARMRQLDTTAVPLPFECHYAAQVPDCAKLERTLHFVFGEKRARRNREFFQIEPDLAKAIISLVAIDEVTLSDAEQAIDRGQRAEIEATRRRREVRTFAALGIPIGSELTFRKDQTITCRVAGPRQVEFEGQLLSHSRAALNAVKQMGYDWPSANGMDYWLFEGVKLSELAEPSTTDRLEPKLDD